jgi:cysteine desulfurase
MIRLDFDAQSSTPVLPAALAAMQPFWAEHWGNPSAPHHQGLRARDALEQARAQVAQFIHASSPEEIIFTASGEEAINLAIKGTAWASQRRGRHIVATAIEHPAVAQSIDFLVSQGWTFSRVPVNAQGFVDPEAVRAALTDQTTLICVPHANHDIGTIEPIQAIGALANERGIPLFVDATASAGWVPLNVQTLGVDLLALTPHRFYGPKGVGVLYRQRQTRLVSLVHGGPQEGGRHAGLENVPGIVGAGVACEVAARELIHRAAHVSELQKQLWQGLSASVPQLRWNGPPPGELRLPNNLHFSLAGVEGEAVLLRCDMKGLLIASGAACLGRSARLPAVLEAIGLDPAWGRGSLLLTLGKDNTEAEVGEVLRLFPAVVQTIREMSPAWRP